MSKALPRFVFGVPLALAFVPVLVSGLVLAGVLRPAPAAASATVLTVLDGSAELARGAAEFAPAPDGAVLQGGDRVRTAALSHAVVTFFDGSTIELEPSTTLAITEARADGGAVVVRLQQALGRTWSTVRKFLDPNSRYEVTTPSSTAIVRGTQFFVEVTEEGTSTVTTAEGLVRVEAQGRSVDVGPRQETTVRRNEPPAPPANAPRPMSTLRFGLHSPAYVAVVDPLGRTCGIVLPGPTFVSQIPGCVATRLGVSPELIEVPDAVAGRYRVVIFPMGAGGPFTLQAAATAGDALLFNYFAEGRIGEGKKLGTALDVSRNTDGTLFASGLASLEALEDASLRVVAPSLTAAPTATGAPPRDVFSPLPGASDFGVGPRVTPSLTPPTTNALDTPSPLPSPTLIGAPTLSPLPTLTTPRPVLETPRPSIGPSPSPTTSPIASPTLVPSPLPSPTGSVNAITSIRVELSAISVVSGEPFVVTAYLLDSSGNPVTASGPLDCSWSDDTLALSPSSCSPFQNGVSRTTATVHLPGLDVVTVRAAGTFGRSSVVEVLATQPTPTPCVACASPSPTPTPPLPTPTTTSSASGTPSPSQTTQPSPTPQTTQTPQPTPTPTI